MILHVLIAMVAGWIQRQQQHVIAYLHEESRGFCQVVEAETLIRQAGASPRSSPPFRRPAPYL